MHALLNNTLATRYVKAGQFRVIDPAARDHEEKRAMRLLAMLDEIRQRYRYATHDDIRNVFGDYHNVLHWLALFLVTEEKLADACVIDVCTIATTATPAFHEWLVYWAVRATFRSAFEKERTVIAELASEYEKRKPLHQEHPPLLARQFRQLITDSEQVRSSLDVLCRFVLVMRGIAKDSYDEVASELGISRIAVERAYCTAFDTLELKLTKTKPRLVPALS